jgi:eukaryotic-like serine/threonine-protein kinase
VRDLLQSTLRGRYLIERELGQGGMGAVYLAQDLSLQRPVAIKVLPPELAAHAELRERFLRETRMAAGFSHPNIVPVHAVEEHPHLLCFVMGFIEGETLGQRVRRAGPLTAADALRLLQEVAWALSYAHGRGVVHRDIKPDNILIERATGRALVTDFGIARTTTTASTSALTRVGEVVGTPQFMSPEQAAGEKVDGRSDLYSLGVVAFVAVTGRALFEAPNAAAVMAMHLTQAPPKVAALRPDLPQPLCAAIDTCLEKDPANRFESGEALAAALGRVRAARPEIAPALRLFQVQASQTFRAIVMILAVELMLASVGVAGNADRLIPWIVGGAIAWGIVGQMVGRARTLLRSGFSFDDVRAGMRAIQEERLEARAQELIDPAEQKRDTRRRRVIIAGGLYAVLATAYVLKRMRVEYAPGLYRVTLPGTITLFSSAVIFGLSLALLLMNASRASVLDRLAMFAWSSPCGRWVFRRAARGLTPGRTAAPAALTASRPLAIIAGMPGAMRRELKECKSRIQRLEQTLDALANRQRDLDAAIAQADAPTQATTPAMRARHAELLQDLSQSRDATIAKREQLAGALENVRLQLLRVRSGVGSRADVVAELQTAQPD